jgi:hypothetical protein
MSSINSRSGEARSDHPVSRVSTDLAVLQQRDFPTDEIAGSALPSTRRVSLLTGLCERVGVFACEIRRRRLHD